MMQIIVPMILMLPGAYIMLTKNHSAAGELWALIGGAAALFLIFVFAKKS